MLLHVWIPISTIQSVYIVLEPHATKTAVALRNAQLSSMRVGHDAATWVVKLGYLQAEGADPSAVLKQYDQLASQGGKLTGQKRTSVLALLKVSALSRALILELVSNLGPEACPWTDETWAHKIIMPPGHIVNGCE